MQVWSQWLACTCQKISSCRWHHLLALHRSEIFQMLHCYWIKNVLHRIILKRPSLHLIKHVAIQHHLVVLDWVPWQHLHCLTVDSIDHFWLIVSLDLNCVAVLLDVHFFHVVHFRLVALELDAWTCRWRWDVRLIRCEHHVSWVGADMIDFGVHVWHIDHFHLVASVSNGVLFPWHVALLNHLSLGCPVLHHYVWICLIQDLHFGHWNLSLLGWVRVVHFYSLVCNSDFAVIFLFSRSLIGRGWWSLVCSMKCSIAKALLVRCMAHG